MPDIFNSAILDSTSLNKKKLHSFILTQLYNGSHLQFYHFGFSYFAQKQLHSYILTQLVDCSHLEFCHVWIQPLSSWIQTPCYLLWDSLKNTLTPLWLWFKLIHTLTPLWIWLQLISIWLTLVMVSHLGILLILDWAILNSEKKLHSFILTQLHDGSHLQFCHDWIPSHYAQKQLHSFILTHLDDGSHLELCHVVFKHCHLRFRHLVIFSQIHSETLSLHSDSDSN